MKWGLVWFAVLLGCAQQPSVPNPQITVAETKWTIKESELSFDAIGRVALAARDSAGTYLVAVRVIEKQRLDPSEPPDSQLMVAIVSRGHGSVPVGDYASRCTEYTKTNCIRKAVDPEVGVQLIGWAVLTPP